MVRYLLRQACKCFEASSILPKCTDHIFRSVTMSQALAAPIMYCLGFDIENV